VFLSAKDVAAANRYVENGPEDRDPSFKYGFAGRFDVKGGILRYSTSTPTPAEAKQKALRFIPKGKARRAIAAIAAASN
jgi:hypothetical protein